MIRATRAGPGGRAYLDLQNLARRQGRPTQELLILYVLERFLARLVLSPHRDTFVLKGGMLLAVLAARRPTVDADFLVTHLANEERAVLDRVVHIASRTPDVDDGVRFLVETVRARSIRGGDTYGGVRVVMDVEVASAAVKLQLDVNFGDPVTPAPILVDYPCLRQGDPPVRVLGYPLVTVLAEKLCTAVTLGAANSRVRDYADIWTLTGVHDVDGDQLQTALQATATYRGVDLRALSHAVADLSTFRAEAYSAYRRRLGQDASHLPEDFAALIVAVTDFADPVLAGPAIAGSHWDAVTRTWRPARTGRPTPPAVRRPSTVRP